MITEPEGSFTSFCPLPGIRADPADATSIESVLVPRSCDDRAHGLRDFASRCQHYGSWEVHGFLGADKKEVNDPRARLSSSLNARPPKRGFGAGRRRRHLSFPGVSDAPNVDVRRFDRAARNRADGLAQSGPAF